MGENKDAGMQYIPFKPDLTDINSFLNGRLKTSPESPGVSISTDNLGNTVYTSLAQREETMAGLLPSQLVVSIEGKSVMKHNPGLLQGIRTGDIVTNARSIGGFESNVYKVSLDTEKGKKDFALKYTFPMDASNMGVFTSGVVAMRFMQEAHIEKPVPHVGYVEPIIATHDVTLAPFTYDGVSFADFMDFIDPHDFVKHRVIESLWPSYNPEAYGKLKAMRKLEDSLPQDRKFFNELFPAIGPYHNMIKEWVSRKITEDPELQKHKFDSADATIRQTVLDLDKMHGIMKRFKSNAKFGAGNEEFETSLLSTLSFVELALGQVKKSH